MEKNHNAYQTFLLKSTIGVLNQKIPWCPETHESRNFASIFSGILGPRTPGRRSPPR